MADLTWPMQRKLLRAANIGFNAEVYRHFKDVDDIPGRIALRDSLLIGVKDSRTTANFKIDYFRDQVQKVHLKPVVIGLEKQEWDEKVSVAYRPLVILFFRQDLGAVAENKYPVKARISFRLMNETSESITDANNNTLAAQIKNELALSGGYTFDKGKYLCKYYDKENGYDLQIYAASDVEGERVARKIVGIRNHSFVENYFTFVAPRRQPENTPGNTTILKKTYKKARWRPTARVRFMYAELVLHNCPDALVLVDRSGLRPHPIEFVY